MLLKYMVKQRLTKMTQMLIRMRILSLKTREKVMSSMPMRDMKRELRREEKTKIAAVLDKAIETLKSVYYPDIPNSLEKNVEVEEEEEEEEEVLLFFFFLSSPSNILRHLVW
ncbi:BnaA01g25050D [Brassica napus]|uniref:(rape) hypothetical protein n=1 Tax=Brassica napus TaxID=3708 RepID=A0A078HFZ4_BRANA|nr:unnamed protein product [Brassica napus]CDY37285.1 BnaA01g25050D [Brassica napus]